jgi:hypothetical protein
VQLGPLTDGNFVTTSIRKEPLLSFLCLAWNDLSAFGLIIPFGLGMGCRRNKRVFKLLLLFVDLYTMEETLVTRYIDIQPASTVANFLKAGYSTTNVAIGSLYSLCDGNLILQKIVQFSCYSLLFLVVSAFALSFVSPGTTSHRADFTIPVGLRKGLRHQRGHRNHCVGNSILQMAVHFSCYSLLYLVVVTFVLSFILPGTTCYRASLHLSYSLPKLAHLHTNVSDRSQ